MKYRIVALFALAAVGLTPIAAHAGPLGWLKRTGEYLFDTQARREAQEQASRRLAIEAAEANSRQIAREAMTRQMGRVSTAFQVGAYTFTGVMIFDTLSGHGYALSETIYENEEVATEIANATADGHVTYQEKYCTHPSSAEKYVVPSWTISCGDGSLPVSGPGIDLSDLSAQASR